MGVLLLKPASISRPSGEWNDDDYDVLTDGAVVGRILKVHAAPVGQPRRFAFLRLNDAPFASAGPPGIRNCRYAKGKSPATRAEHGLRQGVVSSAPARRPAKLGP